MTLMTPTLQVINEMMIKLNVSIFWTGYTRANQTYFHESHRDWYASCGANEWTKPTDNKRLLKQPGIIIQWFA